MTITTLCLSPGSRWPTPSSKATDHSGRRRAPRRSRCAAASAALRHLVWTLALCSALALPVLSIALPKWQLPIVAIARRPPRCRDRRGRGRTADRTPCAVRSVPARRATTHHDSVLGSRVHDRSRPMSPPAATSQSRGSTIISWQQALLAVWLVGAVDRSWPGIAIGLAAVRWLSRRTQVVTDAPWLPMAQALAADLGVHAAAALPAQRPRRPCRWRRASSVRR